MQIPAKRSKLKQKNYTRTRTRAWSDESVHAWVTRPEPSKGMKVRQLKFGAQRAPLLQLIYSIISEEGRFAKKESRFVGLVH